MSQRTHDPILITDNLAQNSNWYISFPTVYKRHFRDYRKIRTPWVSRQNMYTYIYTYTHMYIFILLWNFYIFVENQTPGCFCLTPHPGIGIKRSENIPVTKSPFSINNKLKDEVGESWYCLSLILRNGNGRRKDPLSSSFFVLTTLTILLPSFCDSSKIIIWKQHPIGKFQYWLSNGRPFFLYKFPDEDVVKIEEIFIDDTWLGPFWYLSMLSSIEVLYKESPTLKRNRVRTRMV